MQQVITIPIHRLTLNEENYIHASFDPDGVDKDLVESIAKDGVLIPIQVNKDWKVLEGHRRIAGSVHNKLTDIIAIEVPRELEDKIFTAAQLGRHMTTYAKCVLYCNRIQVILAQSELNQSGSRLAIESTDGAWAELEAVLAANRRTLTRGVKLLNEIIAWENDEDINKVEYGKKARHIFRQFGLYPCLRMLGQLDEISLGEIETDKHTVETKRSKRPWKEIQLNKLASIRRNLDRQDKLTPKIENHITILMQLIGATNES